jgi:xylulokinase
MWHWMGVMLSAGGSLRWFRDALGGGASYDDLMLEAAGVEAGCEGLLFLPYLTGERTPHADPLARGAFAGLTVRHSRGHLARAVIEGVSFGLRDSLELMRGLGLAPGQARVSGGGAKSALWRQILADVLNVDIVTVNSSEGAAYGAAVLAAVGAQAFPDVSTAAQQLIRVTSQISPGRDVKLYAENYPRYQALYPALRSVFNAGKTADQKAGD